MSDRSYRSKTSSLTRLDLAVLVLVAVAFVCGVASPYVLPKISDIPIANLVQIVECSDLPQPLGGNNRSILSIGNNANALDIDLHLGKNTYAVGEYIELTVVFNNHDNGPIVIYNNEDILPPISLNDGYSGLMFEIERVGGAALIDQAGHQAAIIPFPVRYLRLLGSRARCTEDYTLAGDRLTLAGLGPGEYRIRAVYNNPSAGVRTAEELNPPVPTPTPFPDYRNDQNVWVGRGESNEVSFTVSG